MINYNYLLNLEAKKASFIYVIFFFFFIVFIILVTVKTYDSYQTYAVYYENNLTLDVPINNSDAVKKASYVKIANDKYQFEIKSISSLKEVENINYQEYILNIGNNKLLDNEVVVITFYYKKELLIKKLINVIF